MYLARNKAKVNVFRQTNPRKSSRGNVLACGRGGERKGETYWNSWGKKRKISASPSFPYFPSSSSFLWTVRISFLWLLHAHSITLHSFPPHPPQTFPPRAYAILNRACNFNPPFHPPCYPLGSHIRAAPLLSFLFLSVWNRNCSRLVEEGASCLRGPQGNTRLN